MLKALCSGLEAKLALLPRKLTCKRRLLRLQLSSLLAKTRLLRSSADGPLASGLCHACRLQSELALLTGRLGLQLSRLRKLLGSRLAKTRLLSSDAGLKTRLRREGLSSLLLQGSLLCSRCRLCTTCLRQLLSSLLAKTRLLSGNASLLNTKLSNSLRSRRLALLLLLKSRHGLGLSLAVALRHEARNGVGLLLHRVAFQLSALNTFALAAKRARPNRLCRQPLLGNGLLPVKLTHRRINDLLLVRVHERLSRLRVVRLRGPAKLANTLL